jgi:starch phosphorylase
MLLTEQLVQGVDLWINTPRRPWEASGTSGMKVLVNGGLNISELDGWWAEAYSPEVGWAIGDGREHGDDPAWDAAEAEELYSVLEKSVIPEFYQRDEHGIPTAWVARIRESMARLTPQFSATRTVKEYTNDYYLPASNAYKKRTAEQCAEAKKILEWKRLIDQKWANLWFGEVTAENQSGVYLFKVQVYLNGIDPDTLSVELYADQISIQRLVKGPQLVGAQNGYVYTGTVPATRPASEYTARIIPYYPGVAVPLESAKILWQK